MSLRAADRGQSIQIGAVLLFGVLVILLASYQAVVVPDQNRQVEAAHVDTVSQQMQELRNAIASVPATAAGQSITMTLGVEYPSRVVAVNPPAPTGAVRSLGTGPDRVNLTVANAVATDDEVADHWTGRNRSFNTGAVAYRPGYNEYRSPPTIVYENSLLYHRFGSRDLTRAGQRLVDGRQLRLLAVNGSLDRSASDTVSVDLAAASASSRQVAVTNQPDENLVVDLASQYDADQWAAELRADGEFTDQGGYVVEVSESPIPDSEFDVVHLTMAADHTYTMRMAKVGVGTDVTDESREYLVDVAGDGATIQEESATQVVLEVRDGLNNPISGVDVHGRLASGPDNGNLAENTVETDEDGQAVFEYRADEIDGASGREHQIDFSYLGPPNGNFDADASENVSVSVTVENAGGGGGGSSGPLSVEWNDPSSQPGVDCPTGPDDVCTSDGGQLSLTAGTTPDASGVEVDFSLNDSGMGSLSPGSAETDGVGEAATLFDVTQPGPVTVFVTGGGSGDAIEILLTVAGSLAYNDDAVAETPQVDPGGTQSQVSFSVTNQFSSDVTVTGFTLNSTSVPPSAELRENAFGDAHEIWIDTDGDGSSEGNYDVAFGEISEGDTVTLDNEATMAAGSTADVRLYQFRRSASGNPFNMGNQEVTIALHYEDDEGARQTVTIPMDGLPTP